MPINNSMFLVDASRLLASPKTTAFLHEWVGNDERWVESVDGLRSLASCKGYMNREHVEGLLIALETAFREAGMQDDRTRPERYKVAVVGLRELLES